jgi:hypothetical protein
VFSEVVCDHRRGEFPTVSFVVSRVLVAAAVVLMITGCADARGAAAGAAAGVFNTELASNDFDSACALLAPSTRERLEHGSTCAQALAGRRPPAGAPSTQLTGQVWGDRALVRTRSDTVFLQLSSTGWKVTAAGCTARGEAPYDCELEGP